MMQVIVGSSRVRPTPTIPRGDHPAAASRGPRPSGAVHSRRPAGHWIAGLARHDDGEYANHDHAEVTLRATTHPFRPTAP
jgi:hypothetical protein